MSKRTDSAAGGAMPKASPLSPADARRFLHTCNDEIEAGMTPDLTRRIREVRAIVRPDDEFKRLTRAPRGCGATV